MILVSFVAQGFFFYRGGFHTMEKLMKEEKSIGEEEGEHKKDD